jgi:hypothetical protein
MMNVPGRFIDVSVVSAQAARIFLVVAFFWVVTPCCVVVG